MAEAAALILLFNLFSLNYASYCLVCWLCIKLGLILLSSLWKFLMASVTTRGK